MAASSVMSTMVNTNTQLLSHVKVSNFMPSNGRTTVEKRGKKLGFCVNSMCVGVKSRFGSSRGGAVLDRPSFDQSQFDPSTQVQQGGDIGRFKDRKGTGSGDSYRVLLLDDERHTENLVAKALPQVVPSVTPDEARKLFIVSRKDGLAVVIVTVKEHAEFYSQMMMQKGLRSSIEPDSNTV
ncbi:hypothetical protein RND81_11G080900 [Saponaria officinalis]|uniref:Adaptor protein ClpS core domain-containing protein n=1 Tax=Saponaria officinalis TaxID=3572 RepID=A0AAW1HID0_SAPOF